MYTVSIQITETIQGEVVYDRPHTFKTHNLEVAKHYAKLNSEWSPVITDADGEIVPPVTPKVSHKVKKWQTKRKSGDIRTYKCYANGDNFVLGLRENGWGYYFKGFWHGAHADEAAAHSAWRKRPLVGNQGIVADATEPLELDMAMF